MRFINVSKIFIIYLKYFFYLLINADYAMINLIKEFVIVFKICFLAFFIPNIS